MNCPLLSAIAAQSLPKLSELCQQRLTNTAWAFAPLAIVNDTLLASIAPSAIKKSSDLTT